MQICETEMACSESLMLEDVCLKLLPCCSSMEILQEVLLLPCTEKLSTIALLWSWWSERNRGNHGEHRLTVEQFQFTVRRHVDEWNQFLAKEKHTNICQTSRWMPPDEATVKINTDAASENRQTMVVGESFQRQ
jgi:hypothetical protein